MFIAFFFPSTRDLSSFFKPKPMWEKKVSRGGHQLASYKDQNSYTLWIYLKHIEGTMNYEGLCGDFISSKLVLVVKL